MKYIYKITGNKAELINQTELYDDVIVMDSFPARIHHENTHAVLSYNETDGIHWEYIPYTNKEIRENIYKTEKLISYDNEMLTVDEANKRWQEYQAENNDKAKELTILISEAKTRIRNEYPDA